MINDPHLGFLNGQSGRFDKCPIENCYAKCDACIPFLHSSYEYLMLSASLKVLLYTEADLNDHEAGLCPDSQPHSYENVQKCTMMLG